MNSVNHEIVFKFKPRDFFDLLWLRFPATKFLVIFLGFVFLASILSSAILPSVLVDGQEKEFDYSSIFGQIIALFFLFIVFKVVLHFFKKKAIFKEEVKFVFYDNRFKSWINSVVSEIPYSAIKKIIEGKRIYVFVGKLEEAFLIPKRSLNSEQRRYFLDLVKKFDN